MKILFLCTAHNSLSQRLYLALSTSHDVTIEYALSDSLMITAAELAKPDLIICPFLTARVPKEVYNNYLTLIIHPGPPGDAGPSALDWLLLGDDGSVEDSKKLLEYLDQDCKPGRSHWGITILQAIEQFDAGPVWAFEQFPIDIDHPKLTKSELYRGPVSRAAISACISAIKRIHQAAGSGPVIPSLKANPDFKRLSVLAQAPFQGGRTHERPLLKAAQRDFDVSKHTAKQISRRIRCGDSQPGALSKIFGQNLYVYGGIIDECPNGPNPGAFPAALPGSIVAIRKDAVCILTRDGRGIWITHIRRPKRAQDPALWPKVSAVSGLLQLGILQKEQLLRLEWELPNDWTKSPFQTFQEIWIDFISYGPEFKRAAYLYFDFYNGAMSTDQCSHLVEALEYILASHNSGSPISALVLMGGAYFSNGIALNVIEAASDPAQESWLNINRIDDVVFTLLHSFSAASIATIAAIRGNAAAGGVALATACDIVIAGTDVVLNPAYRGIGLFGSEYHTLSYFGRCGEIKGREILRAMTPLSAFDARAVGLVDHVLPGTGTVLDKHIRNHISVIVRSGKLGRVKCWKTAMDISLSTLAAARAKELGEMSRDFWSARASRYHSRRFAFVRKVKATHTPFRFARHRRVDETYLDEEERDTFDDLDHYQRLQEEQMMAELQRRLESRLAVEDRNGKSTLKVLVGSPRAKSTDTVFSCYYSTPELIATPPGGLSAASSVNGGDLK
jgi:enoyl-CoA hydratase/carnithine racemase/methionyl-tRNA formyltransferase